MLLTMREIINVALREHDDERDFPADIAAYTSTMIAAVHEPAQIPSYASRSKPLSLVSFSCMLQDTGYPMEVYLPEPSVDGDQMPDLGQLRERWIGWAVEVPGLQPWASNAEPSEYRAKEWTSSLRSKYPLKAEQTNYLGALIKIYDEAAYKPASQIQVIGILSTACLPSGDSDELVPVPTIHVLRVVDQPTTIAAVDPEARSGLISYLANLFEPQDPVAAELLMLTLLSAPISRQPGQEVLGTLSLNIITPESTETSKAFIKAIGSVSPYVVTLPLSIASLHDHAFLPTSADSTSLASGILQLCNGTVLAIQEGEMGSGGQLEERAVKNLQALVECLRTQTLQYVYPYMDNLRMDCAIRGIVFSEGKSLIPVDLTVLVTGQVKYAPCQSENLSKYRSYLEDRARRGSDVTVPDEVALYIQDDFVRDRQSSENPGAEAATDRLKRRMRIARLLAQSYADQRLTQELWRHACMLDEDISRRLAARGRGRGP